MTPEEKQWFTACLKSTPRDICELMWSPNTRPTDWDLLMAWLELRGLGGLPVLVLAIAGFLGWMKWKFRKTS